MKMNWGVGITITIIVFLITSLSFLYYALNQKINLVQDDYYEEAEAKYQTQLEKINRTKKLSQQLKIEIRNQNLYFQFPEMFNEKSIEGDILLYRPSNRDRDLAFEVQPDSNNYQKLSTKDFLPGMWKVKVNWMADSITYFNEQIIMVQ